MNILERGSQVHAMAEMENLFDFPPAPKLNVFGRLDPASATQNDVRGQDPFFGKAQRGTCHSAPYYTDNSMHNLRVERFHTEKMINGRLSSADGPIKTFPLGLGAQGHAHGISQGGGPSKHFLSCFGSK